MRTTFWRTPVIATAVFLIALGLRLHYVETAQVVHPVRGDAVQYVRYAKNLTQHGVFSKAAPGAGAPQPDAFRSPGYPVLIAAAMSVAGDGSWLRVLLWAQAFLGAFTALLAVLVARLWLGWGASTVAGLLAAFWPHLITLSGHILSETLFAALLTSMVYAYGRAWKARSIPWAASGGIAASAAYLVNPVIAAAAVLCGLAMFMRVGRRVAIVALCLALAGPMAWAARNHLVVSLDAEPSRAVVNFVQGSWPEYHDAHLGHMMGDASQREVFLRIQTEWETLDESPREGLGMMWRRMARDPVRYMRWYVLEKPMLQWAWSIRIGQGDLYAFPTVNSPFQVSTPHRVLVSLFVGLNPVLGIFAFAWALAVTYSVARGNSRALEPGMPLALTLIATTTVHVILQAEPRYSVPYRPLEMIAAVSGLLLTWRVFLEHRSRSVDSAD